MEPRTIESEGATLWEAEERLRALVPAGCHLVSQEVVCDGSALKVRAAADTVESAYQEALRSVPAGASIAERTELTLPGQVIVVEAWSRSRAREMLRARVGKDASLGLPEPFKAKSFKLIEPGRRAFVGFENGPFGLGWSHEHLARYQAEIDQATVEVVYNPVARVSAVIAENPVAAAPERSVPELVDRMVEIYRANPEGFVRGEGTESEAELRSIGALIDGMGGFAAMREAHALFAAKCDVPGAARNLEHLWDGVGSWSG